MFAFRELAVIMIYKGPLVRSRLTIKTQGWGIWGKAPVAPAVMAKY